MAQLVRRRVVNPAPSILALVNPRRRKRMATRKRRRSTKRRVHRARAHNPVNPTRRRRATHHRRRRHSVFARRRRTSMNPVHHRRRRIGRRRHHRNPLRGASGEILSYAGAGIGLGLFQPIVQRFVGPYAGALGQFGGPALTALSGWGLSKIFEMFGFTRRFAHPALVLGFSTAVIQLVQPIVSRTLAGAGRGGGMAGYRRNGMGGIGVWPGVPPGVPLMAPAPPMANGMGAIGAYPGVPAMR